MNAKDLQAVPEMTPVDYDPFVGDMLSRVIPTTEAQREVWLADRLGREASLAYNESVSLFIEGEPDAGCFAQALSVLTARHDVLRATVSGDGMSLLIAAGGELPLNVTDLRGNADSAAALARLRAAEVETPFDLVNGPLFRATLVQLDGARAEFILTAHHIVCDGWSFGVLATELMQAYGDLASGAAASTVPADSFAAYALAQLDPAMQETVEQDTGYWIAQFDGAVPELDLPTDRPRPACRTFESRREDMLLEPAFVERLRAYCSSNDATLFAAMFGVFAGLMGRIAGSEEVVVGVPTAGQAASAMPALVGHCVNLLPVRVAVDVTAPARRLVREARGRILDAYEHQACSYGRLLQKLQMERDPSRLPLVSVLFNLDQAAPVAALSHGGLTAQCSANPRHYENFELFLNASQGERGIRLELQYNTGLFDRSTVRRWLDLYRAALQRVAENDAAELGALFMPADADLAQLAAWNATAMEYPRHDCAHHLVQRQAEATPERVAVSCHGTSLRYVELERRANRLAQALRARGVRAGQRVGLCLERSVDMVVAVVGILKSGAAYVPLDPGFPPERLTFMAEDAALTALVTQTALAGALAFPHERAVLLDADAAMLEAQPAVPPVDAALDAGPMDAAYVIYTSGSTGKPKGVLVPHRGIVSLMQYLARTLGISAQDRMLAVTTLSFDIAVTEVLLPLTVGAEVVVAGGELAGDSHALAAWLPCAGITAMQATPGRWRMLFDAGWQGGQGIKALTAGEPLSSELAARLLDAGCTLWNLYGPTETTIYSTGGQVTSSQAISIGRPVANTAIHILDERHRPCPVGIAGEIWIGGDGVALGYLNRQELTAERFIDNPFSATPGARLYRTGDRGRWRADGEIEHLGRNDFQVKVRGYRIEPGEIEACLAAHENVAHSVVIAREDVPGDVRLVAYVVPRGGEQGEDALHDHLRTLLPAYMVPQHIVPLERLPLSPNGKIDRKALPRPVQGQSAARERLASRTPLEREVLAAMEDVLHFPGLDLRDNFFAFGGHSLLASQLAARIGKALGLQLPLRAVFDAPTAEGLAKWVAARQAADETRSWQIACTGSPTAPLSLMQQRIWFVEQMEPGRSTYNTPSAHRLRGKLDESAFNEAFNDMIAAQEALRTVVDVVDEHPVQLVLPELRCELLPVEDLRAVPASEREAALLAQLKALAGLPLELAEAPLFRARLFRLADEEYVFYFGPHHIIWDGWSFDVLYLEMAARYEARRTGSACALAAPAVSYNDFAAWQRDWMQGKELAAQLAHWKALLADATEPLAIPADRPRPAQQSGQGATKWIDIGAQQSEVARCIARSLDATPFMLMLAVYVLNLHKTTGQTDIVVGTPVRGRQIEALEKVMGMFVNVLPLRLKLDPEASFTELLRSVRDTVVDAFKYPDVPFEHLVRELKRPRDRSRFPIYQALFSFQDARGRQRSWGNLEHDMIHVLQPGIAEDVALWLMDRGNAMVGGFSYNTDIIDEASAERMRLRYQALLDGVLAQPDQPLRSLSISAHEQTQLAAWNDTARPYERETRIHELIERQVAAAPDRIAVSHGPAQLTYAELDARANRLAHALRARGIGRGCLVGLCLERGSDMLAAQLAALKSGAAYVPLDPSYPAERLRFMAEDAALALLVTQSSLAGVVPFVRERALLLDADAALLAAQPRAALPADAHSARPQDPAYVIYTSGSTGQPKGVQVPHRAVVNFLSSMRQEPGIGADDRLVAVTTLSFDIAVLELLLPLTVGAAVVLAGQDEARDPHALVALLAQSRATVMQATPGTWRMLLDAGWQGGPEFKALVGGEALAPELAAHLLPAVGELWNMYGPTETTVWSTCLRVTDAQAIRIGRPIANTTVWILDEQRHLCPIGTPGEIWIGGEGVTLGYLNRPQLTAERYIDDPFSRVPGARLYRTGDRGRWRADGLLEHLGRNDFQVKVRGYRIELGEIEACLERHAGVAHSVVVVREDVPGDVRLVAYFTSAGEVGEESLRAHVREHLPGYMQPQHFVRLPQLPLLPNGKINRKDLPTPLPAVTVARLDDDIPLSATEALLASVWKELLKTDDVGAEDNFFDLGGHSLLAMQSILVMETRTGKRLNPRRMIFETLRQVAKAYEDMQAEAPKSAVFSRLFSGLLKSRKQ